ncbi:AOX, alternative oxidase mitochondrial precursor [Pisolithus marmoratus]|nr:AOX, alternative oxidase mitochondrial precursor [Pisolithus marmoratus]
MSALLRTSVIHPCPLILRSVVAKSGKAPNCHALFAYYRAQLHTGTVNQSSLKKDGVSAGSEGPHPVDLASSKKGVIEDTEKAATVPPAVHGDWVLFHPVYTPEELRAVLHRQPQSFSDKVALNLVKLWGFDLASGYKHKPLPPNSSSMSLEELRRGGYVLTERAWLMRILFLETIAGVPGMVAAMLRHLTSLRSMRRDSGWIHTLLEDAENERMHLMTFMVLKKSSIWFRAMILGAQGVFSNLFFFSYLISPRACHRFVGHLEEEAVLTYTRCIQEMEAGHLPEWTNMPAPEIAKDYWRLPDNAKLLDVMYAVRSDESTHRFINHSLANLNPKTDVNPFALREPDMHVKGKKLGFERSEAEEYVAESHKLLHRAKADESQQK